MAGALGLRLAGPRIYGDVRVDDAWMGDGSADASEADLRKALRLYRVACAIEIGVIMALAIIVRV
jgi:adenosylcobinamide-phosphate synthase